MTMVVQKKISQLTPYAANSRKHSEKQIERLAESIRRFGFNQPIVTDKDGVIIVGHARYQAAVALDLKTVPVIVKEDLSADHVRAYRIADNSIHDESEWAHDVLLAEIEALEESGYDYEPIGLEELRDILGGQLDEPEQLDEAGTELEADNKFTVVFESVSQFEAWNAFIKRLKKKHPDCDTVPQRLIAHIESV